MFLKRRIKEGKSGIGRPAWETELQSGWRRQSQRGAGSSYTPRLHLLQHRRLPRGPCLLLCLLPCHPQLKISFSETALETTYQYPSESSVLEELGPDPETPSVPGPSMAQPDDEEDEEELLLQRELQSGLRTKALIVGELARGRPLVLGAGTAVPKEREEFTVGA